MSTFSPSISAKGPSLSERTILSAPNENGGQPESLPTDMVRPPPDATRSTSEATTARPGGVARKTSASPTSRISPATA
jgi:hypothetical protein